MVRSEKLISFSADILISNVTFLTYASGKCLSTSLPVITFEKGTLANGT